MIRSKQELEAVAREWTNRAKHDLRNQMISFIEENGTNEGELADALAISVDEIDQILNGNGEISLSTFAKILIATDNVIEIKPAAMMPQRGHMPMGEGRMPRRPMGRMPMMSEDGYPMPPMGEMPNRFGGMPGMGKKVKRPTAPCGGVAPQRPMQQPQMQRVRLEELELDELGRNELTDIVRQNHWDSEIDVNSARRSELIDFLNCKIQTPPTTETAEHREENENERIGRMLADEVARNPHLKEMVKKYLH